MGKQTASRSRSNRSKSASSKDATGKHLVIVESPAKAKTINKYLGPDFVVEASVGHVRDLPARAPKGSKQPVPGVDLENRFKPTYEVLPGKKKTLTELKKLAKQAADIWFATDLDREGEAIAWHLAQELGIPMDEAKRVVFNAITKSEIERAFAHPQRIDEDKVNAQQARRILDRIVGYQVSPLLWKKVSRGLSAGRVQSVAVRLIVEREREIRDFVPDEEWRIIGRFTPQIEKAESLGSFWREFMMRRDAKKRPPTMKEQNAWLAERGALKAELFELGGKRFELGAKADEPRDLSPDVRKIAEACGLRNIRITATDDPDGKGPAKTIRAVEADVRPGVRYRVKAIETKKTTTRPSAPFITSTIQMAASTSLGFGTNRTMRIAQSLYETGYITYMRTDSTHLTGEAINQAREYVIANFGGHYLPDKPVLYTSNPTAQEAHEAIRPTDARQTPEAIARELNEEQLKLYRLIWSRFIACQMLPATWNATSILLERSDQATGAVFRTTGRVLTFDGFFRATGVPTSAEEQTLPDVAEGTETAAFTIEPQQVFTSPPPRYSEASLVKTLESEGIGRPSTYASIVQVIQDRKYVEQIDRRFFATDLGEVVTDKLIDAFPRLMDLGYTRRMEAELDKVADQHTDWTHMLQDFYDRFSPALEHAHETMSHAKAERQPAIYKCPVCGGRTCYRFGKNGRFLSCSEYPDCDYASPIDRQARPLLSERVNVACPEDGSPMEVRTGRFGKFLASVNYPAVKCVINLDKKGCIKYPAQPPVITDLSCPKCGSPMNLRRGKRGPWLGCSTFPKCRGRMGWTTLDEATRKVLEQGLEVNDRKNPPIVIRTLDGQIIPEGTPVADLIVPGGLAELEIHPDAKNPQTEAA